MPLFMDRHDIREATAEEVAQTHHSDLEIQSRYSCKALTYWYDESRGAAFCLISLSGICSDLSGPLAHHPTATG